MVLFLNILSGIVITATFCIIIYIMCNVITSTYEQVMFLKLRAAEEEPSRLRRQRRNPMTMEVS